MPQNRPRAPLAQPRFLPMTAGEMQALGWDGLDVLLVSGDAYVDHPSFGSVLLGRWLVQHGFRTGIVAQPRWDGVEDVQVMGRPRLFVGVSAGAVDSMVAHYTAFRKKRSDDAYTPGGQAGARPNRACLVYANVVRQAFPGLPVVLGGIEASLRRVSHYDFWSDALRKPILMDAKAQLLVYGMGERAIVECARRLDAGLGAEGLRGIAGTAWMDSQDGDGRPANLPEGYAHMPCMTLPGHEQVLEDKARLLDLTRQLERHVHDGGAWACQSVGSRMVVLAPPAPRLDTAEMDALYRLPYMRTAHPAYTKAIPAEEMLKTSITSHRGCGGGCSFCSLAIHQGRRISSRSKESILAEVGELAHAGRSGRRSRGGLAISDVGGPTANMWQGSCQRGDDAGDCGRASCCHPTPCAFFRTPQQDYVQLLREVAKVPGVKQVRVASGIRADLALRDREALAAYVREFTGGQLKVAPEHSVPRVLALMRKPGLEVFEEFLACFVRESRAAGREQYVVPYLLSAFPGCTDADMRELADWLRARHWNPRQTQCFIPTPGSMATAMFYCGKDATGQPIYVARTDAERLRQHRILTFSQREGEDAHPPRQSRQGCPPARPQHQGPAHRRRK